jgi:hypothetical protein
MQSLSTTFIGSSPIKPGTRLVQFFPDHRSRWLGGCFFDRLRAWLRSNERLFFGKRCVFAHRLVGHICFDGGFGTCIGACCSSTDIVKAGHTTPTIAIVTTGCTIGLEIFET